MPTTLRQLAPMDTFICKQLKAADLDRNLTLRIIATAFWMQETYLESKQKKRNKVKRPLIWKNICDLFGISSQTYGKIMQAYLLNKTIYVSGKNNNGREGNKARRPTRVPRTKRTQLLIQEWV